MNIGNFSYDKKADTYSGNVKTLTVMVSDVRFVPNEKSNEKQPDYRIIGTTAHGDVEFGSAWKRTGEKGEFLSVSIDDPSLTDSLNAALFTAADGESATLVWTRPKAAKKKAA